MNPAHRIAVAIALAAAPGCAGIEGSGHIVGEARPSASFRRLVLEGAAEVQIAQGAVAGITVIADDNLIPYVETRLAGDELRIAEKDSRGRPVSLLPTQGIRVVVTTPEVPAALDLSGSGSITFAGGSGASGGALALHLSGSGSMVVQAALSGVDVELSGSGDVRLEGSASRAVVAVSGSGDVDAFAFPVASARVDISGSGSAQVAVRDSLEASVSGSGMVIYRGSPVLTCTVSGSGAVRRD